MRRLLARSAFVVAALSGAAPALANRLATGGSANISIGRILAALVLCLFAAAAMVLVLRQRGLGTAPSLRRLAQFGQRGRMRVLEVRRLSVHADLCLVQFDNTEILILCGSGGVQVLADRVLPLGLLGRKPVRCDIEVYTAN